MVSVAGNVALASPTGLMLTRKLHGLPQVLIQQILIRHVSEERSLAAATGYDDQFNFLSRVGLGDTVLKGLIVCSV
jgi:hypothetical protein